MMDAAPEHDTLTQDAESAEQSLRLSRRRLLPPAGVPGYKIGRCLGEGAYGSVWLAWEQNTGKQVAIKFYTHRGGLDWSLLNREVEKLAVLYTCREIVRLIEVGWDAQPPYYIMEYLENGSLGTVLKEGTLSVPEAVTIADAVLLALVHAHGSGILHCDLKPANVLLDSDLKPRLADFGQSRLSNEQDPSLGTLFYMAPEQADLAAVPDARWDVYALGSLLYHCLCGHPPYRTSESETNILSADSLRERLAAYRRVLQSSPKPTEHRRVPGMDRQLADIIDRCLEIKPHKRYPNAQAVLDAMATRAKLRARRPAIVMGIIAPLLLLCLMLPLGMKATDRAVATAESSLSARASESNKLAAEAVAELIEGELLRRIQELQIAADDPRLAKAMREEADLPREQRNSLKKLLHGFREKYGTLPKLKTATSPNAEQDLLDTSWLINDTSGRQLFRDPFSKKTIDQYYHWRDYFHWLGSDLPKYTPTGEVSPDWAGKRFHISVPFQSQETNRYMIALSVLVRSDEVTNAGHAIDHSEEASDNQRIVGILGRTIDLGNLLATHDLDSTENVSRIVAIAEGHSGRIVDHPWIASEDFRQRESTELKSLFAKLELNEDLRKRLTLTNGSEVVVEENYTDPIATVGGEVGATYNHRWLAAFARVPGTDWWTVVQERRDEAVAPVGNVQSELTYYGLLGLGLFFSLIGALWFFLLRGVKNRALRFGVGRSRGYGHRGDSEVLTDSGENPSLA